MNAVDVPTICCVAVDGVFNGVEAKKDGWIVISQRDRPIWERIAQLAVEFLPLPRILHPWPSERFAVKYPRWEAGA
jgi:hypothetical protein